MEALAPFSIAYETVGKPQKTTAIIVSAGSSSRMGGVNKQFAELLGLPVIVRTLMAFEQCADIADIVVVTREHEIPDIQRLCIQHNISKLTAIVSGGASRTESVENGIKACRPDAAYYAIHDGARPLVTPELITRVVRAAWDKDAAALAAPVKDTIKIARDGVIESTPDRSTLYAVQTPQVFERELYTRAMAKAAIDQISVTDDCALCERLGAPVYLVESDYFNLKITTAEDLQIAEALLVLRGSKP